MKATCFVIAQLQAEAMGLVSAGTATELGNLGTGVHLGRPGLPDDCPSCFAQEEGRRPEGHLSSSISGIQSLIPLGTSCHMLEVESPSHKISSGHGLKPVLVQRRCCCSMPRTHAEMKHAPLVHAVLLRKALGHSADITLAECAASLTAL